MDYIERETLPERSTLARTRSSTAVKIGP